MYRPSKHTSVDSSRIMKTVIAATRWPSTRQNSGSGRRSDRSETARPCDIRSRRIAMKAQQESESAEALMMEGLLIRDSRARKGCPPTAARRPAALSRWHSVITNRLGPGDQPVDGRQDLHSSTKNTGMAWRRLRAKSVVRLSQRYYAPAQSASGSPLDGAQRTVVMLFLLSADLGNPRQSRRGLSTQRGVFVGEAAPSPRLRPIPETSRGNMVHTSAKTDHSCCESCRRQQLATNSGD